MTASDVRCPVCGQGVLIHNAARSRDLLLLQRSVVREELREQHAASGHNPACFLVDMPHAMLAAHSLNARAEHKEPALAAFAS